MLEAKFAAVSQDDPTKLIFQGHQDMGHDLTPAMDGFAEWIIQIVP